MDDRQSSAEFRVSNGPLLYPILENTAHSAPEQFGLILPSIKYLHLPMNKAVDAQTRTQTRLFQANHSRHQSGNPTSLPSCAATVHVYKYHSNKPYTSDQIRFIQCKRDDENMPWKRVTEGYNKAFPGYYRSQSGIEARYYREQAPERFQSFLNGSGNI
ncbi:hypothetical protein V502_10085, partial [Pseudogymnoascus sp. VKM F-4520 (FW-2644)]